MELDLPKLNDQWLDVLSEEFSKPYFKELQEFIQQERVVNIPIYPSEENVYRAFHETPFDQVKVVILGQDPYHGPSQAHGLSFSVPPGIKLPPSLKNIFKELETDIGIPPSKSGYLISWAKQGVLLLNTTLTVRQGEPMSHAGKGWERFTDAVILKLIERKSPVIFLLWGNSAQEKFKLINNQQVMLVKNSHVILQAAHPSPFSAYRGFFQCRHFSKVNQLLLQRGLEPINWEIS